MAILKYINGFYNPRRRYSALGCKSPVVFEKKVAETSTGGAARKRDRSRLTNMGTESQAVVFLSANARASTTDMPVHS